MTSQGITQRDDETTTFIAPSHPVDMLTREIALLAPVLATARAAQWGLPPRLRPVEDTAERSKGPHSDPTPNLALDDRRLALSSQIKESERIIREAAAAVRGVRRGLEMRFADWEAEAA